VTIKNHGVDFNRWEERSGVRWVLAWAFFSFFCLSHVFVCLKVQRTRMQR